MMISKIKCPRANKRYRRPSRSSVISVLCYRDVALSVASRCTIATVLSPSLQSLLFFTNYFPSASGFRLLRHRSPSTLPGNSSDSVWLRSGDQQRRPRYVHVRETIDALDGAHTSRRCISRSVSQAPDVQVDSVFRDVNAASDPNTRTLIASGAHSSNLAIDRAVSALTRSGGTLLTVRFIYLFNIGAARGCACTLLAFKKKN